MPKISFNGLFQANIKFFFEVYALIFLRGALFSAVILFEGGFIFKRGKGVVSRWEN